MSSCHVFLQVLAQVSLCQGLPPDICSGCPSSSYPHCLWGGGPGVHRKAFMEVCCWLPDHHPVSGPWLSSSVDSWLDDWQFGVNNLDDYMLTAYFIKTWLHLTTSDHIWPSRTDAAQQIAHNHGYTMAQWYAMLNGVAGVWLNTLDERLTLDLTFRSFSSQ